MNSNDWNFDDFDLDAVKPGASNDYLPPTDESEESNSLGWPFVKIMQSNSILAGYRKGIGSGMIAVGSSQAVEGATGLRFDGWLFEPGKFGFFLLDALTARNAKQERIGSRAMFPFKPTDGSSAYDADSSDKKPTCKSPDGRAPIANNIGKVVQLPQNHPSAGGAVVIGLSSIIPADVIKNGGSFEVTFPAAGQVCDTCPLSKWWKPVGSSKSAPPLCSQKFSFVVYIPRQMANRFNDAALQGKTTKNMEDAEWPGGFAILQGSAKSTQAALVGGEKGRSPMKTVSGKEISGIYSFFARNPEPRTMIILKDEMHPSLKNGVKGFAAAQDAAPVLSQIPAELTALAMSEDYPYVVVDVPTFKYAQMGLPQHVGIDAALPGMRYLNMNLAESVWSNNPLIPDLFLDSAEVSREDLEAWLAAGKEYKDIGAKAKLLFPENIENVQERLDGAINNWRALLPSGAGTALSSGQVVEGEFVDEDISSLSDM